MNLFNKILIGLTLLTSCPIIHAAPSTPAINPLQAPIAQAAENNACEELLKQVLKVVDVIDFSLEHMAQVVNNDQLRGIDKKAVLAHLIELRTLVSQLKKHSIVIKKDTLVTLVQVCQGLLEHVHTVIHSGLTTLPKFDPQQFVTRSKHMDFPEIAQILMKQSAKVQSLERSAQHVGLSFVNKAFRKAEEVNTEYKVLQRVGFATAVGAAGVAVLYMAPARWLLKQDPATTVMGPDNTLINQPGIWKNEQTNQILYKLAAFKDLLGTRLDNWHKTDHEGILSGIQHLTTGLVALNTVAPFLVYEGAKNIFGPWIKDQWNWVKENQAYYGSKLRGGPIRTTMNRFKQEPRYTFDNVIGNEHAKEALMPLVHYLLDHEKYDRSGIVPGTGVLLIGDPRTGKTYTAEAVGGTIRQMARQAGKDPDKFSFYKFTAADLKEWGIPNMLRAAQSEAPVIIFIDELDTGGFQREADARSLCQLMTMMSELNTDKSKKVVLIGATNKPQNLDYALLQPGRFGTKIQFHYPTEEERKKFITRELNNRAIVLSDEYIQKLAHQTKNCPFDEIFEILTKALQQVKIHGATLTEQDLEHAYDQVVHKIIHENDLTIPEEEEQLIAIHRAGQAVARILLQTQDKLLKVTNYPVYRNINEESVIHKYLKNQNAGKEKEAVQADSVFKDQKEESIQFGKVITTSPTDSLKYITADEMKKELQITLAGFVAERLLNGSTAYIYNQEAREQALNIAKFICYQGINPSNMPKVMREEKLQESHKLMNEMEEAVTKLLQAHEEKLLAVANKLHEERILTAEDIEELLK